MEAHYLSARYAHRMQIAANYVRRRVHVHSLWPRWKASTTVRMSSGFCMSCSLSSKTSLLATGFLPDEGPCDLDGYMEHVRLCNSGIDRAQEFLKFVVEDMAVGYIHPGFAEHLRRFDNVFFVPTLTRHEECDGTSSMSHIILNPVLRGPEERTQAVADALEVLRKEGLIPGWRNELLSVVAKFEAPPLLALERAAVPFFGTKAYGVHMNGYVVENGEKHLWVAKRSATKQTFPGMLDHLVAGGQPQGLSCKANLVKECEEEAGIPKSLAENAVAAGAVSYCTIHGQTYKRDVLFCYDLDLPRDFQPSNTDGEVEKFMLLSVPEVSRILRTSKLYKPNCALVLIDFLIRHGHITPDDHGYLQLLQGLRSGECS